jgi:phage terminase large subunit GpA-like protein
MCLLCDRGQAAFMSEYQNDPIDADNSEIEILEALTKENLSRKCNHLDKAVVPADAVYLIGFCDIGKEKIHYVIAACRKDGKTDIVDYGTVTNYQGKSEAETVWLGLDKTCKRLFVENQYLQDGTGQPVPLAEIAIDSGWQTETIYNYCKSSAYAGKLRPSKGQFVKAGDKLKNSKERCRIDGGFYALAVTSAGKV